MLIDTHCHVNILVKQTFDTLLEQKHIKDTAHIVNQAAEHHVSKIINVGTSLIESKNCITLAQKYPSMYATVGIHPNDCTKNWKNDFKEIVTLVKNRKEFNIIGVGETGLDRHYPDYNFIRQTDAFKAHIELALEHQLPLIDHTRNAHDEVLTVLDNYSNDNLRGVIHCFSEGLSFARHALELNFVLGIGGPLTYPKNTILRKVFTTISLDKIILETDSPFLPPQIIRGKQNHPKYIKTIAEFLAKLRNITFEEIAKKTTSTAKALFKI